ncbi:hypothetical protein BP6252_00135 [Coleophoma cylindrospora]|uniref:Uncharacterized protein n=1 Tax=Coleophoma cylindrospora TaxID=1849047 RepID=A0A3D8SP46_9HELO|nr:hypothetical protein BP6252_00135 [Coleophoma cylindrospora]
MSTRDSFGEEIWKQTSNIQHVEKTDSERVSKVHVELAKSIFTPFTGIPTAQEQPVNTLEDKLKLTIASLERQHEAARKNMLILIENQGLDMIKTYEAEIKTLNASGFEDEDEEIARENWHAKWKETQELIGRLETPMKEGTRAGDYEEKIGQWSWAKKPDPEERRGKDRERDVNMDRRNRRTTKVVKAEMSAALRELIEDGLKEMARYDRHAAETLDYYDNALKKERARFGKEPPSKDARSPTSTSTAVSPPRRAKTLNKGHPSRNPGWADPRR